MKEEARILREMGFSYAAVYKGCIICAFGTLLDAYAWADGQIRPDEQRELITDLKEL